MSSIQLYDRNGEQRFDGTSVGGGGSQPVVQVYGPYTVAFDQPGASVVLWNAKAGDLILDLFVIPTVSWSGGSSLEIYCTSLDFTFPAAANSDLTVSQDSTRFTVPRSTGIASFGPQGSTNVIAPTPSLMKIDADVTCDVIGSPAAGVAKIWALVFPAA